MRNIAFALPSVLLLAFSLPCMAETESLFTRLTQQSHVWERTQALEEMEKTDIASKKILAPQLAAALKDNNPYVRQNAAEALGALDKYALDAVDDLRAAEKDPAPDVRMAASITLARLGRGDPEFIERLIAQLDTQPRADNAMGETWAKLTRYEAANALGFIASGPLHMDVSASVMPLSHTVVSDQDKDVKNRAAWALGVMGTQARPAIPALRAATEDPAERDIATWALERIK